MSRTMSKDDVLWRATVTVAYKDMKTDKEWVFNPGTEYERKGPYTSVMGPYTDRRPAKSALTKELKEKEHSSKAATEDRNANYAGMRQHIANGGPIRYVPSDVEYYTEIIDWALESVQPTHWDRVDGK